MAIDFVALFDPLPKRRQAPAAGAVSTDVQAPVVPGNAPPSARWGQGKEAQAAGGTALSVQQSRPDCPEAIPDAPPPETQAMDVGGLSGEPVFPLRASARPGPAAGQVVQESPVDDPSGKPAPTESPSAPGPRGDFHSVWLSIPVTSRIYAFDRRDRLCFGPDCYLWTFERSPIWYYQSETPLPPLRRQGEDYYVDTQAVLEIAKTPREGGFQEQNRPKTFACR